MPPHENCSKTHISAYAMTTIIHSKTPSLFGDREVQFCADDESFVDVSTSKPQHNAVLEMEVIHHRPSPLPKKPILKSSNRAKRTSKNTNVQFKSAHIRTYSQVLGDHPCCSSGLPLSLGWRYSSEQTISVDEMERNRGVPSKRRDLRLDETARKMILQSCEFSTSSSNPSLKKSETSFSLYSREELRRAERRLSRERQRMRKRNIVNQFFSPVNALESE